MSDVASSIGQLNVDLEACRRSFMARQERKQAERERRRQAALEAAANALMSVLPRYPTVRRAYLFGSVSRRGAFRIESDVDIAVEGIDAADFFPLWRDLEEAMPGWTVDLRELVPGSDFARRVQERGWLVYEGKTP